MDMGSYVLADNVLGFSFSYDSQGNLFNFNFDIGSKQRKMWIQAELLIQIGALSKSWKNVGQHSPARMNSEHEDPVMTKLKAEATTDDGAILYPEFPNGKSVGLVFSPIVWREFLIALRK